MTSKWALDVDINGKNTFGLAPSVDMYSGLLVQDIAQTLTVPSQYSHYSVIFSIDPGLRIWVSYEDEAEYPNSSIGATTSEFNPGVRILPAGTEISFITPDTTAEIGVVMYGI